MNITLLGHYDIASLYALDRVINLLPEHRHKVLLSGSLASSSVDAPRLAALSEFDSALCDRFLSGDISGPIVRPLAVPSLAILDSPNAPKGLQMLGGQHPDLIISIRYRRILREEAISIPRLGVLNLHSGILPDYRGVMATFWAMLAGEKEIGTTMHWIVDSGIDTGPILALRTRATRPKRSYLANVLGLYAEGGDMIAASVRAISAGRKLPVEPQTSRGQYFRTPEPTDIQRFESKGLTLFDGEEPSEIRG